MVGESENCWENRVEVNFVIQSTVDVEKFCTRPPLDKWCEFFHISTIGKYKNYFLQW